ncbi:MAG: TrbC/VirB2 family protein [Candidatus Kerfeldbacteria bacterium]|nr:TrbC/VirB2 family protein [Candidatus Kerfeldbacteria bacterium]
MSKTFFHRLFTAFVVWYFCTALPVFASELANPLGENGAKDPNALIGNVIKTLLGVVGGITLLIFIYGGVMMLISHGDSNYVKKGRDTLTWALVGLIIIFGSYALASTLFKALG